jgi:hypothetical protein
MKAFNGNLKPYFQVPISFVHYTYKATILRVEYTLKIPTFITITRSMALY